VVSLAMKTVCGMTVKTEDSIKFPHDRASPLPELSLVHGNGMVDSIHYN